MPVPPLGGLPWLLDRLGLLQDDPARFDEASQASRAVLNPSDAPRIGSGLAAQVGLLPQPDETLASFWGRQMPRTLSPSLKEPLGRDIELPTEKLRKRSKP